MARQHIETRAGSAGRRPHTARIRWRDVLSVVLLALFALQGVVVQGHSHAQDGTGASVVKFGDVVIAKSDDGGSGGGSAPRGGESSGCGLCQSLGAGTAPLALAIALLLPAPQSSAEPAYVRAPVVDVGAVSYAWTPRGPPELSPLHA
ncbi:MAG TPA: DUF2946 family protein [Gammaproteobacteria bacterium]|jgi:hypothetical protein|nr:DUF2946 family protein [Gammaproteobacteria bacterium]